MSSLAQRFMHVTKLWSAGGGPLLGVDVGEVFVGLALADLASVRQLGVLHRRRPGPKQEHTPEFKKHWQQQMKMRGKGKKGGKNAKGPKVNSNQRVMHPGGFRPLVPVDPSMVAGQLLEHINSNQVLGLVVGMPIVPGGGMDKSCKRAQDFIKEMQQHGGVPEGMPVFWQDETNSTKEAEQWATATGLLHGAENALKRNNKHAKGLIDQEAACIIARRFVRNIAQVRTNIEAQDSAL